MTNYSEEGIFEGLQDSTVESHVMICDIRSRLTPQGSIVHAPTVRFVSHKTLNSCWARYQALRVCSESISSV